MLPIGAVGGIGPAQLVTAPNGLSGAGVTGASAGQPTSGIGGPESATGGAGDANDPATSGQSFLNTLGNAFGQLNTQLTAADASMADFAAGGSSDIHTVMLEMQEASIGLKVGLQVRDRLLEAYQEIMRLQI